jgi:ERF superfamily
MRTSPTTVEISKALVAFHKEVGKVKKNARNPFFKSSYATLSNVLVTIDEPLTNNGLTFVQFPSGVNGLSTRIMHVSGEWIEDTYIMEPVKEFKKTELKEDGKVVMDKYEKPVMVTMPELGLFSDPQKLGSVITYQRRYALGAVLGLNIDVDDDGNAGSGVDAGAGAFNGKRKNSVDDLPTIQQGRDI